MINQLIGLLLAVPAPTIFAILQELLPYASVLFSAYVWYKNSNKEQDKQQQESFKKLQSEVANHGLMHQASQQEREHLVDKTNQRFTQIEHRLSQGDQVLHEVNAMKIKMEVQSGQVAEMKKTIEKLSDKLDRVIELMTKNK